MGMKKKQKQTHKAILQFASLKIDRTLEYFKIRNGNEEKNKSNHTNQFFNSNL